jgi:hypothetical protein
MHCLRMKKSHHITRGSDRSGGRPLELQHQHGLISHPTRPTQDRFDRGVDRLDDAEADRVIAVDGDPSTWLKRNSPSRSISGRRCHRSASIQPLRKFNTPVRVV